MLWALSAVIILLASHVLLGWVRQAQAVAAERRHWFAVAMAATAFGTALSAAVALSLSGESLAFPVGYQRLSAAGIWLGSVAVLVPAMALLAFWPSLLASLAAGLVTGAVATVVEAGWVTAAGFRPGVIWNRELLLASWLVCSTGFATSFALGFPRVERAQHYRYSWRIAAAALMALSFAASLALVIMGAGLPTQVGSIYRHELSGTTVSLLGGGVLPLVLVMMIVDLEVRRRQRRRVRRKKRRDAEASRFVTFDMPGESGGPVNPATQPAYARRSRSSHNSRGLGVPLGAAAVGGAAAHLAEAGESMQHLDQTGSLEAAWTGAQAEFAPAEPAFSAQPAEPAAGQDWVHESAAAAPLHQDVNMPVAAPAMAAPTAMTPVSPARLQADAFATAPVPRPAAPAPLTAAVADAGAAASASAAAEQALPLPARPLPNAGSDRPSQPPAPAR